MKNEKPSSGKYSLIYGLVYGLFGVVLGLMLFFLDMHYQNDPIVQVVAAIVGVIIIMYGIIQYKKENEVLIG